MLCILSKGSDFVIVNGVPDIYLDNNDFDYILRNPEVATKLRNELKIYQNGILIGRLGELQGDTYVEDVKSITINTQSRGKELCFYEAMQ